MIVKYTAQYSDGTSADFLSLEDLIAHDGAPELHSDVGVTQNPLPAVEPAHEEVAPVPEAPAEAPAVAPEGDVQA